MPDDIAHSSRSDVIPTAVPRHGVVEGLGSRSGASMAGVALPYRWTVTDDELTIKAETLNATFRGRWNEDGTLFSGGWRPDPGHENDPGNIAYDIAGGRAS